MHSDKEIIQVNIKSKTIEVHITRKMMKNIVIRVFSRKIAVNCPTAFKTNNVRKLIKANEERISRAIINSDSKIDLSMESSFETVYVEGHLFNVIVKTGKDSRVELNSQDKVFTVFINEGTNPIDAIKNYFSDRTKLMILNYISENHGEKKISRISIKDNSSNWGSCSTRGNLNFNLRLGMLPIVLAHYVIEHEIAHLTHMNHSIEFYNELGEKCPQWKENRIELKKYTIKAR